MLAVLKIMYLLGFRNVYLIGADFNMSEKLTYHFEEDRHKGAVKNNLNTYKKLESEYFPMLKPYFDDVGFKVYNCTKNSKLTAFPYIDYEKAIQKVCMETGNVESRTKGLYSKKNDINGRVPEGEMISKNKNVKALQQKSLSNLYNKNLSPTISVENKHERLFVKSMKVGSKDDLNKIFNKKEKKYDK